MPLRGKTEVAQPIKTPRIVHFGRPQAKSHQGSAAYGPHRPLPTASSDHGNWTAIILRLCSPRTPQLVVDSGLPELFDFFLQRECAIWACLRTLNFGKILGSNIYRGLVVAQLGHLNKARHVIGVVAVLPRRLVRTIRAFVLRVLDPFSVGVIPL